MKETNEVDESFVNICYTKLYKNFIEHIDGIDNGISVATDEEGSKKIKLNYQITTHLSNRIGLYNLNWNEEIENKNKGLNNNDIINERFHLALSLATEEFLKSLEGLVFSWYPAREIVMNAVNKRHEIDASGKIIFLDNICPWKDHLFDIEKEVSFITSNIYIYILFFIEFFFFLS